MGKVKSAKARFLRDSQTIPNDEKSTGLKVVAAGQWRCATSSLQWAFEQVLDTPRFAPSLHGSYLMPSTSKLKHVCLVLQESNPQKRQQMLQSVFDGYNASTDFPGFVYVDDLLDMYPGCKVVLNKRVSAQQWERSVGTTLHFFSTRTYFLITYLIPQSYWHHQLYRCVKPVLQLRYGVDDIFSAECYERHNQWVREIAAERRVDVLEWDPRMGWEPLCRFLECEVPDVPFPTSNETAEIKALTKYLVVRGLMAWAVLLCIAILLAWLCRCWLTGGNTIPQVL